MIDQLLGVMVLVVFMQMLIVMGMEYWIMHVALPMMMLIGLYSRLKDVSIVGE